jgi:phosphoribosylanthranilate isomerase
VKEKFSQNKRIFDENVQRTKSIHNDSTLDHLQYHREREKEAVQSLSMKFQREIYGVIEIHKGEIEKRKEDLSKEWTEWKERKLQDVMLHYSHNYYENHTNNNN